MSTRLGIIPHTFAQPLFHALGDADKAGRPPFHVTMDLPLELSIQLRQQKLDGAFISPIDFARIGPDCLVIPDAAAVSAGKSRSIVLLTNTEGRPPATVAARLASTAEIVLAHLIIREEFELSPTFVPLGSPPLEALESADAVLAGGDDGFAVSSSPGAVDLVESWWKMTALPFVHGFWVTRNQDSLTASEIGRLQKTAANAPEYVDTLMSESKREYVDQFYYHLDADALAGIAELYRMAFYHGMLRDVPDLRFYTLR